jgi:putative ABC transport system permease protein
MFIHYLKLAVKVLLRRKLFTAISLFGITFTLIVLVLVAALVDHAVGPSGPERRQDRILIASATIGERIVGKSRRPLYHAGYRLYERLLRDLPGAEATTAYIDRWSTRSYRDGRRIDSTMKLTDAGFWKVLNFTFLEGRGYDQEDVAQARPVAVISEGTRRRFFDGAPALGRTIELDGRRFRVVGVVPEVSVLRTVPWADLWVPVTTVEMAANLIEEGRGVHALVLARTRGDIPGIRAEVQARAARWDSPDPRKYPRLDASISTRSEKMVAQIDQMLFGRKSTSSHATKVSRVWLFALGMTVLFMLLPAVNLVNLNVSRILERASEIGVRKSFGASSRALVTQFVVENVVLTCVGGALALALSMVVFAAIGDAGLFGSTPLVMSPRVFLAGMAMAVLFGLVSGVYPAWKMARMHPLAALRGEER